jgi:hypothetical protein
VDLSAKAAYPKDGTCRLFYIRGKKSADVFGKPGVEHKAVVLKEERSLL